MQQPSIEELERAYREACVVHYLACATTGMDRIMALNNASRALAILEQARQRQAEKDEEREAKEAAAHSLRQVFRKEYPSLSDYAAGEAVSLLWGLGWRPAPSPSAPAQTQQEQAGSAEDYEGDALRVACRQSLIIAGALAQEAKVPTHILRRLVDYLSRRAEGQR